MYWEWSLSAIYFIMIPVIICFVHADGKLETDRVFEARALYWALQLSVLWCLSDCVHILSETRISYQRVQVLIINDGECSSFPCFCCLLLWFWLLCTCFCYFVNLNAGGAETYQTYPSVRVINVMFPVCESN